MLQELLSLVSDAEALTAELAARFEAGDAADDLLDRLTERVGRLTRLAAEADPLPDEARAAVLRLLEVVQATTALGETWLAGVGGPELAALTCRQRVLRTYRPPPRDD